MKTKIYPANKKHFEKLIPFAQEVISLCNENKINPIIYGSFAHFYYTKDKSLNVNDIDFLILKKEFPKILREIKKKIKAEIILDVGTIIIKKGKLIIELDSSEEKELNSLQKNLTQIDFYGTEIKIIGLKDLENIYPIAFNESSRNKGKVLEKIISLENFLKRKIKGFDMKNKEVCLEIHKSFSIQPEVLSIFNNGSSIVGQDDKGSDMDFVIVLKKSEDEKKIRELFRKKYEILKNEEDPEIEVEEQYEVLGKRVDPTIISKKEIENKVYGFYNSIDNYLNYQHFIKHKIVDSISLFDKEKLLPIWKKEVEKYPRKFMGEVVNSQIISIKENLFYWRHHKFRNEFQFGFEYWDVMKAICQALYAKNNRMFMLPYKRIHNDLKELKPNIEKEMYQLVRGDNTPEMIKKKSKIVEKILAKLEK
jgi:hypothetical protein